MGNLFSKAKIVSGPRHAGTPPGPPPGQADLRAHVRACVQARACQGQSLRQDVRASTSRGPPLGLGTCPGVCPGLNHILYLFQKGAKSVMFTHMIYEDLEYAANVYESRIRALYDSLLYEVSIS